jgi:hypothetical protein
LTIEYSFGGIVLFVTTAITKVGRFVDPTEQKHLWSHIHWATQRVLDGTFTIAIYFHSTRAAGALSHAIDKPCCRYATAQFPSRVSGLTLTKINYVFDALKWRLH